MKCRIIRNNSSYQDFAVVPQGHGFDPFGVALVAGDQGHAGKVVHFDEAVVQADDQNSGISLQLHYFKKRSFQAQLRNSY
jgi:hypothetical protein